MPRTGRRRRIARSVYEDSSGRCGIYRDGTGRQVEVRFPPYTPVSDIREEIARRKGKGRASGQRVALRGSLAHAVDRWARLEQHLASWRERRAELRAWVALYGPLRLTALREEHVRRAMSIWATAGVAAKTIRNRLWTLRHLFRLIAGPRYETPCDHIHPPAKVRHVPTPIPPAKILAVYAKLVAFERSGRLRTAKTRARFMVRASTGRRPSEIMRARPEDVDLGNRVWRVRDGKGGWSEGLYLNDDMLIAWMTFAQANAWGKFRTGGMAKVLRAAGWPAGIRPYQLRHSIGIGLSEAGIDLADVSAWLGHTSVQTTRSIYAPVLNSRMQRASEQLSGRLHGWSHSEIDTKASKNQ